MIRAIDSHVSDLNRTGTDLFLSAMNTKKEFAVNSDGDDDDDNDDDDDDDDASPLGG